MKKKYIKPCSAVVKLNLIGSVLETIEAQRASNPTTTYGTRETTPSIWDEEEEEEDLGGWFK